MNIKEAKEQIKNAMIAYFSKDEFGNYVIPIEKQRPVFLMGPPGIGKTAIMEQIAAELGVGLVSYSMTHHTRQSALGLPFIVTKNYGGKDYEISEYTMSEIIASVYDMIETTGHKEGILFLDEINCVSETLAPAMLQFLQYKIFGRHTVPEGWIVVTAGNPSEYNNSVREFDIVTWDRLKRVDVEADYDVWKEYAYKKGVHASILTYLDIKRSDFYLIETTVDGKSFVTARGWSDLSDMIQIYEKNNIAVDQRLVEQYLQNSKIAKSFAIYYDLFNKYKSDYQVDTILSGKASDNIKERAKNARFDERLALLGMLIDKLTEESKAVILGEKSLSLLLNELKGIRVEMMNANSNASEIIGNHVEHLHGTLEKGKKSSSISSEDRYSIMQTIAYLEDISQMLFEKSPANGSDAFKVVKEGFDKLKNDYQSQTGAVSEKMDNVFKFIEEIFADGQEMLILVTEITMNFYTANCISRFGCAEYFKHNKELLFYERQKGIIRELNVLDLED